MAALLAALALGVAPSASLADDPQTLTLRYDAAGDRVLLEARDAALIDVLDALDRDTPIRLGRVHGDVRSETISATLDNVPLEQALDTVLNGFAWVLLHPAPGATPGTGGARPERTLIVLSRKGAAPAALAPSPTAEEPDTALAPQDHAALADALMRDRNLLGRLRTLPPGERRAVGAGLLDAMQKRRFASYGGAMKVLEAAHEMAPDDAEATMADWLQAGDQQQRMIAATGLARFAGESAVPLLSDALVRDQGPVRQVAANGLARIGGRDATGVLLDQYASGDRSLQMMAVTAVSNHGGAQARTAMAERILATPLPTNTSAEEVLAGYLSRQEEGM